MTNYKAIYTKEEKDGTVSVIHRPTEKRFPTGNLNQKEANALMKKLLDQKFEWETVNQDSLTIMMQAREKFTEAYLELFPYMKDSITP